MARCTVERLMRKLGLRCVRRDEVCAGPSAMASPYARWTGLDPYSGLIEEHRDLVHVQLPFDARALLLTALSG